ncbi:hypothetical protein BG845_01727 [Pseudonocardia autotrophica]|uniref:Uncharacterized protein n=1 Tax=Pseudonocardia autotrophica TaxID=2074 RepID=A0A1Y2N5N6_PSEAH|nr:hypothetical protein BG845_01727 [Pseudonocardia autotrophica]
MATAIASTIRPAPSPSTIVLARWASASRPAGSVSSARNTAPAGSGSARSPIPPSPAAAPLATTVRYPSVWLSAASTSAIGTPTQHSSHTVVPAALTTRSAAAIAAGRSDSGATARKRAAPPAGNSGDRPGGTTTSTSAGAPAAASAATTRGSSPAASVPPITTSTRGGSPAGAPAFRTCRARRAAVRNGAKAGPRSSSELPSSGRGCSSAPRLGSTTTSPGRLPVAKSSTVDSAIPAAFSGSRRSSPSR